MIALRFLLAVSSLFLCGSLLGDGPFLELRFNHPETDCILKNGAEQDGPGSGVSSKPDDKSYVARIPPTAGAPGPLAALTKERPVLKTANALTLTLWYKLKTTPTTPVTVYNGPGGVLIWDEHQSGWVFRLAGQVDSDTAFSSWFKLGTQPELRTPGQWVFVACVWNKQQNLFTAYFGTETKSLDISREYQRDFSLMHDLKDIMQKGGVIGNSSSPDKMPERWFDGNIDNVRFYAEALSRTEIEKIRTADLRNERVSLP